MNTMQANHQPHTVNLRSWCLCEDDIGAFRQIVQRGDHRFTDGFLPESHTESCEPQWIKGMVTSNVYYNELHYAVDVDGVAVGCLNVSRYGNDYNRMGLLRLILLPEMCGLGIGTQVIDMLLHKISDYNMKHYLGFERLNAHVFGDNQAAKQILEKNGFIHEGTMRHAARKEGHLYDIKIYGIVINDEDSGPTLPDDKIQRIMYIQKKHKCL